MTACPSSTTDNAELHGEGEADEASDDVKETLGPEAEGSDDERTSPTRPPGIPGHGMTSNMPEDAE